MILALVPFIGLMLAAVPWWAALSRRFGGGLSFATVATAAGLVLLGVASLTPLVSLPTVPSLIVVSVIALCAGAVYGRQPLAPIKPTIVVGLAAASGAVVWLAGILAAQAVPGSDVVSWAMYGDAPNNLLQARVHLDTGGLDRNNAVLFAVPLTSVVLSVALSLGRPSAGDSASRAGDLLAHDLLATTALWSLAIMATSTLIGLVASSLLSRHRALAAAAFSLIGLTWLVSGLPIESGYLNTPLVVSLLLLAWLGYLGVDRSPHLALAVQFGLLVLVMAVWTPAAIVPAALAVGILVRHRQSLRESTWRTAVAPGVTAIAATIWLGLVVVPSFLQNSGSLGINGHGFPSTVGLLGAAMAVAVGLSFALRDRRLRAGAIAVSAAAAVGLLVVLRLAANAPNPFAAYYPTKFTWIVAVPIAAIAVSLVLSMIARRTTRMAVPAIVAIAVLALSLASIGPSPVRERTDLTPPLARILTGGVWQDGDRSAQLIIDRVGEHTVLYATDRADEAFINYWLLVLGGGAVNENVTLRGWGVLGYHELRDTSRYETPPVQKLCELLVALGQNAVVITADDELERSIAAECSGPAPTILIDDRPIESG